MMEKLFLIMFALVVAFAYADIVWVDYAVHVGGP